MKPYPVNLYSKEDGLNFLGDRIPGYSSKALMKNNLYFLALPEGVLERRNTTHLAQLMVARLQPTQSSLRPRS
jgi:hypothetical protein